MGAVWNYHTRAVEEAGEATLCRFEEIHVRGAWGATFVD
jgi:hypothetical protein